jgi:signal transduction histidine kinase
MSANHKLLVRDIARGATLLLRGEAQNAELSELVRRADDRVTDLRASHARLTGACEVERRWLADELTHATAGRTSALRDAVAAANECLARQPSEREAAQAALARVGTELDSIADRIRATGRRIFPRTLHGSGLAASLEELVVDLRRPVQWSGDLGGRLDWEIECGVFCAATTALRILSAEPSEQELLVVGERAGGRVAVRIVDPRPSVALDTLRVGLAVEVERLAALGGGLELIGMGADQGRRAGRLTLDVWLPDRLESAVAGSPEADGRRP